ncbi:RNA polymerase sigma factor [Nocardia sp. NPDC057668]|uniref:RNA polymerase sigma factor n=1 Tax=Nocardia sp. NPDC057668 TaxID=3346202 RepID=UPI00366D19E1
MTATGPAAETGPDDVTLVYRARDGDLRSFETLVLRYQGAMYRLALRMLNNRADAEDVVQDVFLCAWRRLPQLHNDSAFVAWLYRMTTNHCLNAIRARKPTIEIDSEIAQSPRCTHPEHAVQVRTQLAALNSALQLLTPEQRACWLLREVHGLSYEEIGDIVEVNTTAVRGRIARARAYLSEVMKPWQ